MNEDLRKKIDLTQKSAERLNKATDLYEERQDKGMMLQFMRRESNILVRLAIKIWFKLRF